MVTAIKPKNMVKRHRHGGLYKSANLVCDVGKIGSSKTPILQMTRVDEMAQRALRTSGPYQRESAESFTPRPQESAVRTLSPTHSDPCYIVLTDLRRAIVRHAHNIAGRVLDYGCGDKPYAGLFRRVTDYVGADFSTNRAADINLDGEGRLPGTLTGFDAVVSTQVLEHVPDVSLYLSECRRALAERAGKLLLTTHGIWEYHPCPRDLHRWTHKGLVHVIEQHGFETCHVEPVTTGLKAILQILLCRITQRKLATGWPRPTRAFYWGFNYLADCLRDEPNVKRALYDFPICYLYIGKVRP